MVNREVLIVFESEHFYAYQLAAGRIQIRLQQITELALNTHALVIGEVATAAAAHRFIERCERYPQNLKYLV